MKLAISGKGGVGKTTFAALLIKALSEEGKRVLAIDADPDANLAAVSKMKRISRSLSSENTLSIPTT